MTREEINKIFEYLEENFNKECLFYFKYDSSNITAYFRTTNEVFAQFYPKKILEAINENN